MVKTYQPINSTALEILALLRDPADVAPVADGIVKARRVHVVEEMRWKW